MFGICIISGTNRKESKTFQIAQIYQQVLIEKNIENKLFSLTELPLDISSSTINSNVSPEIQSLISKYIEPYSKFVFISPEYNGSFPGILKLFLDVVPPRFWTDKKAALVGVADGRAGNLRGMEHLTNILNHLKINVYHNKIPVSQVNKTLSDESGNSIIDLKNLFNKQSSGLIAF
jgi:chromate reductase, NAD(P)H dehydrogenase (quinone)